MGNMNRCVVENVCIIIVQINVKPEHQIHFRLVVWSIMLIDLTKGLLTGGEWGKVVGDKN